VEVMQGSQARDGRTPSLAWHGTGQLIGPRPLSPGCSHDEFCTICSLPNGSGKEGLEGLFVPPG
jgi:hypothetical protein